MARGRHRKPKRITSNTAVRRRAHIAGSQRFFTPFVWVVILLGLSAICTSIKGIEIQVKIEP